MSKRVELIKQAAMEARDATQTTDPEAIVKACKGHTSDHRKVLDEYIAHTGNAKSHKAELLKTLFANGTPDNARHQTLREKTASVLKK